MTSRPVKMLNNQSVDARTELLDFVLLSERTGEDTPQAIHLHMQELARGPGGRYFELSPRAWLRLMQVQAPTDFVLEKVKLLPDLVDGMSMRLFLDTWVKNPDAYEVDEKMLAALFASSAGQRWKSRAPN